MPDRTKVSYGSRYVPIRRLALIPEWCFCCASPCTQDGLRGLADGAELPPSPPLVRRKTRSSTTCSEAALVALVVDLSRSSVVTWCRLRSSDYS